MLGSFDILLSYFNKLTEDEIRNSKKFNKYFIDRKSDLTWICFLPRRTNLEIAQRYSLFPKNGNILAYEVPLDLISSNPNITRKAFFSLIDDFENDYAKLSKKKGIAFLGISVGSIPALFLANKYNAVKVRIVCSTSKLGEGIFQAFAARKIKKDAIKKGFDAILYDEILDEINPIKNIDNLPQDTKIVISKFDNYVPYRGGIELAERIRKNNKNAKIYNFSIFGHLLTIFKVGQLNREHNFLD